MPIRFVTGNEGKVREARDYLGSVESVEQISYDYTEVQADDLQRIAAHGAREAFEAVGDSIPVFVEDSGLFVEALEGFPGPYSAYVEDTVGVERIGRLLEGEANRRAHFRSVIAYASEEDGEVAVETFEGSVGGTIVDPRGEGGFGYDPIFEYDGATFAEMDTEEKNAVSHRGRALERFADWLAER